MKLCDGAYAIDSAGYGAAHELTFAEADFFVDSLTAGIFDAPGGDKQTVCTQVFQTVPKRALIVRAGSPFSLQGADGVHFRGHEGSNPEADTLAGNFRHTGA